MEGGGGGGQPGSAEMKHVLRGRERGSGLIGFDRDNPLQSKREGEGDMFHLC